MRYLKNYWAEQSQAIPGVRIHTLFKPAYICTIAGVSVSGMTPQQLLGRYIIHTTPISYGNIDCLRVSLHVYTQISDLDRMVRALTSLAEE